MDTSAITHRTVEVHGLRLHLAEAGPPHGPVVLLLHGFPECWYSWRHQLGALAAAGFRAVAPDQRGYARSAAPAAVEAYTLLHLVGDALGVLDASAPATTCSTSRSPVSPTRSSRPTRGRRSGGF